MENMDIRMVRFFELLKLQFEADKIEINIKALLQDACFTEEEIDNMPNTYGLYAFSCVSVNYKVEYAAFAKRISDNETEMVVDPQKTERYCRQLLNEMTMMIAYRNMYIEGSEVIKKRSAVEVSSGWEEISSESNG